MKRDRIYFGLLLLGLVGVIIWSMLALLNVGKKEETYTISVIVNDSNNDRWIAMRAGLEQAAQHYNIELNYVSTGQLVSLEEEMLLLNREVEHGTDGMIVQMVDADVDLESMSAISSKAILMLVETDIVPEEHYAYTGPDNTEIGSAIAQALKQDLGKTSEGKTIGILAGNQKQLSMRQRLKGLEKELSDTGTEVLWVISEPEQNTMEELREKQKTSPVDILITLGNAETEAAVDYLQTLNPSENNSCFLYGAGCSEKAVYYLDKGMIRLLVVPNEFNMGYQSMATMVGQLKYRLSEAKNQKVDYLIVDRTTLYDEENQKILFPIVQ
ncbi:MAG: substrate-binding domain-containing protein [Lachnospiraceae bacterium]|nr:substrate-binding domain-containing protein [Lachnospiraceae bacterium]